MSSPRFVTEDVTADRLRPFDVIDRLGQWMVVSVAQGSTPRTLNVTLRNVNSLSEEQVINATPFNLFRRITTEKASPVLLTAEELSVATAAVNTMRDRIIIDIQNGEDVGENVQGLKSARDILSTVLQKFEESK